jgi:hypothetical protein
MLTVTYGFEDGCGNEEKNQNRYAVVNASVWLNVHVSSLCQKEAKRKMADKAD